MALGKDDIRERAENDLSYFIKLVAPHRVLGSIHEELIEWWTRSDAKSHQLVLLPRAHQKSQLLAFRVAHAITIDPTETFLYLSSTSGLAQKQLYAIKQILTAPIYQRYWPEMVNKDEGKREKWSLTEIAVDHPLRKKEGIRDSTIFTGGLTTSLTGFHCSKACLDDVVVQENAYTYEGRNKVKTQYSLLSSIENPGAEEWVAGTRYDPRDLYNDLMKMEEEVFDEDGELIESKPVYEVFQRQVETDSEFIWPRQQRSDGKWFGFNWSILNKKKAQYLDRLQFYSQYYNSPNMGGQDAISPDSFQYYNPELLSRNNGTWYYQGNRLNVVAAIDFAYSLNRRSDFTALVVIGIDGYHNVYVLDIDRFKTENISGYYEAVAKAYSKWGFRKLRAETTAAQKSIVKELKNQYLRPNGIMIMVDEYSPTKHEGAKEERIDSALRPRYDMGSIYHYRGGNCQILEEELIQARPAHDDVKDALTAALDIAIAPSVKLNENNRNNHNVIYHSRFGGVSFG